MKKNVNGVVMDMTPTEEKEALDAAANIPPFKPSEQEQITELRQMLESLTRGDTGPEVKV